MKIINKENILSDYKKEAIQTGLFTEDFLNQAELVRFEKGEMIIRQSIQPKNFFYIVKGSAQVRNLLPNGKLLAVNILKAPCMMGEMELIDETSYPLEVFSREETYAFSWNMEFAKEQLLADTDFLKELARSISRKERLAISKLAQLRGYSSDIRLAQFILDNTIDGVFAIKKVDVADFLGISYRHTEKLFTDLTSKGILRKEKTRYFIRDEKYLIQLTAETSI